MMTILGKFHTYLPNRLKIQIQLIFGQNLIKQWKCPENFEKNLQNQHYHDDQFRKVSKLFVKQIKK